MPLRPDCLAIVNNFAFLLGGEELGPDGEFHASSKVYRYDPRQNSWLRMADMSVPRSEESKLWVMHVACSDPFCNVLSCEGKKKKKIFLGSLSHYVNSKVIFADSRRLLGNFVIMNY